jgi:addiction module HigA family antidote
MAKRGPEHPGAVLQREMTLAEINSARLAEELRVPVTRISQILDGERDISPDTALRLARFFGSSARLWLDLQRDYGLACAHTDEIARDVVPLVRVSSVMSPAEPMAARPKRVRRL